MIPFPLVFDLVSTKPSDLVDYLYVRSGHAIVPETQRTFVSDFSKARRDEVSLGNYARNRWGIRLPNKGGYALGESVPVSQLLLIAPLRASARGFVRSPGTGWSRRGGVVTTVEELFKTAKMPLDRCHWVYRKRRLIVRIDPARLDEALPDLALALGAVYDAKGRTIDFDPKSFRAHVRLSIPESLGESSDRSLLSIALLKLAILGSSDRDLSALYSSPQSKAIVSMNGASPNEREVVRRYALAALKVIDRSSEESGTRIRDRFDLDRPSVEAYAAGFAGVIYTSKDGKSRLHF